MIQFDPNTTYAGHLRMKCIVLDGNKLADNCLRLGHDTKHCPHSIIDTCGLYNANVAGLECSAPEYTEIVNTEIASNTQYGIRTMLNNNGIGTGTTRIDNCLIYSNGINIDIFHCSNVTISNTDVYNEISIDAGKNDYLVGIHNSFGIAFKDCTFEGQESLNEAVIKVYSDDSFTSRISFVRCASNGLNKDNDIIKLGGTNTGVDDGVIKQIELIDCSLIKPSSGYNIINNVTALESISRNTRILDTYNTAAYFSILTGTNVLNNFLVLDNMNNVSIDSDLSIGDNNFTFGVNNSLTLSQRNTGSFGFKFNGNDSGFDFNHDGTLTQKATLFEKTGQKPRLVTVDLGSPEGVVAARVGSLYLRADGSSGATLYIKESGNGTTTGWVAK